MGEEDVGLRHTSALVLFQAPGHEAGIALSYSCLLLWGKNNDTVNVIRVTHPLPDKHIMYHGGTTEHDAHTDDNRRHDGGGLIKMKKREQDNSWK